MRRRALTTLSVDRFTVPVRLAGNFVCGTRYADEFDTSVKISTRGLDGSGFVTEVKGFIELVTDEFAPVHDGGCIGNTRMFAASCEQLAEGVAFLAHRELGDRLERVEVTVENATGEVVFLWEKEDELPTFPRRATDAEIRETLRQREEDPEYRSRC